MKNDIEIAQESKLEHIDIIARRAKIKKDYLYHFGNDKAKIDLKIMNELNGFKDGKLILVTAINPTKAGEGKSTTTVGLVDGLNAINKNTIGCLREPSLGPVFGLKGGATGGGYAQVVPMEDINLHFTGDMHAITTANNLISACLDNSIYQGNPLNINPEKVVWKRCIDMNDRCLRDITIGQKKKTNGVERQDGFLITVASEIMAILCLSKDLNDFIQKVSKCIVAYDMNDNPILVKDLEIEGALGVVMKDAIKPNLVQTLEHNPVLIHGGPFANIAHGCNSMIATKMALKLGDYVVTEAGFGADLGAEKFCDIKCRKAEIKPNAVVVVATVRALKSHGGQDNSKLKEENLEALELGMENLKKHLESIDEYNLPKVVAINKFVTDTQNEINFIKKWCEEIGVAVVLANGWASGSRGMTDLAAKVVELCEKDNDFKYLYEDSASIKDKISKIATKIYGADGVDYSEEALTALAKIEKLNVSDMSICMAKTPVSLSDNPKLIGRPKDFKIHVKDLKIANGAGFIICYTGNVLTMPGLPKIPAANNMGIDEKGNSYGLF